jgi:ribosome-associated protein YbcJ (S4-like RNA binding protein)
MALHYFYFYKFDLLTNFCSNNVYVKKRLLIKMKTHKQNETQSSDLEKPVSDDLLNQESTISKQPLPESQSEVELVDFVNVIQTSMKNLSNNLNQFLKPQQIISESSQAKSVILKSRNLNFADTVNYPGINKKNRKLILNDKTLLQISLKYSVDLQSQVQCSKRPFEHTISFKLVPSGTLTCTVIDVLDAVRSQIYTRLKRI